MKIVKVKDIVFNEGSPKICIPLVGETKEEILKEIKSLPKEDFDLLELRIDYYKDVENHHKVIELLNEIRALHMGPLLFTFRTKKEGGNHEISDEQYFQLNSTIIKSGLIDLVDIELLADERNIEKLISLAKRQNVKVIMSSHDFYKTPSKDEIVSRLVKMQEYDADITKIAVMANSEEDVLILLAASLEMKRGKADRPFITISMGSLGMISRISGSIFGSCMTFGSSRESSAPGQVHVQDMKGIFNIFNNCK